MSGHLATSSGSLGSSGGVRPTFNGHLFKKASKKSCDVCNKFMMSSGLSCRVCGFSLHNKCAPGESAFSFRSLPTCGSYLCAEVKGRTKLDQLPTKKRREKLHLVKDSIVHGSDLLGYSVELYLMFLRSCSADEDWADDSHYEFFEQCTNNYDEDVDSPIIFYGDNPTRAWDVFYALSCFLQQCHTPRHIMLTLKCYYSLLNSVESKLQFVTGLYANALTAMLDTLPKPPHSHAPNLEVLRVLHRAFTSRSSDFSGMSVRERLSTAQLSQTQRTYMGEVPGRAGEHALGTLIDFLHKLTKVKVKLKDYPNDTARQERKYIQDILRLGSETINEFYHYRSLELIRYIDERKGLAIILHGANLGYFSVHHEISREDVVVEELLYESVLCKVFRGTYLGKSAAIKTFDPKGLGFSTEEFRKEISLLASVRHPNVCRFFGACTVVTDPPRGSMKHGEPAKLVIEPWEPFLVTEFFANGSLVDCMFNVEHSKQIKKRETAAKAAGVEFYDHSPPRSNMLIANMAMQCASGIQYLHQKNIIHRDIKGGNFLVDDHYHCYVIDFGVSRVSAADPTEKMTLIGTPVWMAPEVLDNQPYSFKADTYSFALVLWSLITGEAPLADIDPFDVANEVVNMGARPKIPDDIHPGFKEIIVKGWDADPEVRPTFLEILEQLDRMTDPITKRPYTRPWVDLKDDTWSMIFAHLPGKTLRAISCCSNFFAKTVELCLPNSRRRMRSFPSRTSHIDTTVSRAITDRVRSGMVSERALRGQSTPTLQLPTSSWKKGSSPNTSPRAPSVSVSIGVGDVTRKPRKSPRMARALRDKLDTRTTSRAEARQRTLSRRANKSADFERERVNADKESSKKKWLYDENLLQARLKERRVRSSTDSESELRTSEDKGRDVSLVQRDGTEAEGENGDEEFGDSEIVELGEEASEVASPRADGSSPSVVDSVPQS